LLSRFLKILSTLRRIIENASENVIYVNPEEDIVVAVSSYFKPTVFDRVDFIEDTLLPCVV